MIYQDFEIMTFLLKNLNQEVISLSSANSHHHHHKHNMDQLSLPKYTFSCGNVGLCKLNIYGVYLSNLQCKL